MLYDPKWEQQTKTDPWSMASFIAWLEQKPADEKYCYVETGRCLIAQYLLHLGHEFVSVGPGGRYSLSLPIQDDHQAPKPIWQVAICEPWTFGAALKRARKVANV
jgi:hypothetical protein